jgi:hypothetical protein
MKRNLSGATLALAVGDYFSEGDTLLMNYFSGTCGGDYPAGYPYIDHTTILANLAVSDGIITLRVPHGGDFKLTSASAFPFSAVSASNTCYEAVKYVYENGYFTGTSSTTFAPETTMTRAMFATVLYRMAGQPDVSELTNSFTDLTQDWYKPAVAWAVANGITNGTSETTFSPDENVSRAEAATFLYRYAALMSYDTAFTRTLAGFTDHKDVEDWAKPAIRWCLEKGVLTGTTETTLAPAVDASRSMLAVSVTAFSNLEK